MRILAIVGSPRRERGLSARVAARILAGASAVGAQAELHYLVDEDPDYCAACGHDCFAELDCAQEDSATARSAAIEAADALVLCSPVYCWQPNGLTAALFDKVRLSSGSWQETTQHGKPALGVAVAGGTGSGVFAALHSIYTWFCLWKYRPLPPLPVTRFNLDRALGDAEALGRLLVATPCQPYSSVGDLLTTYDTLPGYSYSRVDEFRWLAGEVAAGLERRGVSVDVVAAMRATLREADERRQAGDAASAANKYVEAYRTGVRVW